MRKSGSLPPEKFQLSPPNSDSWPRNIPSSVPCVTQGVSAKSAWKTRTFGLSPGRKLSKNWSGGVLRRRLVDELSDIHHADFIAHVLGLDPIREHGHAERTSRGDD